MHSSTYSALQRKKIKACAFIEVLGQFAHILQCPSATPSQFCMRHLPITTEETWGRKGKTETLGSPRADYQVSWSTSAVMFVVFPSKTHTWVSLLLNLMVSQTWENWSIFFQESRGHYSWPPFSFEHGEKALTGVISTKKQETQVIIKN